MECCTLPFLAGDEPGEHGRHREAVEFVCLVNSAVSEFDSNLSQNRQRCTEQRRAAQLKPVPRNTKVYQGVPSRQQLHFFSRMVTVCARAGPPTPSQELLQELASGSPAYLFSCFQLVRTQSGEAWCVVLLRRFPPPPSLSNMPQWTIVTTGRSVTVCGNDWATHTASFEFGTLMQPLDLSDLGVSGCL